MKKWTALLMSLGALYMMAMLSGCATSATPADIIKAHTNNETLSKRRWLIFLHSSNEEKYEENDPSYLTLVRDARSQAFIARNYNYLEVDTVETYKFDHDFGMTYINGELVRIVRPYNFDDESDREAFERHAEENGVQNPDVIVAFRAKSPCLIITDSVGNTLFRLSDGLDANDSSDSKKFWDFLVGNVGSNPR